MKIILTKFRNTLFPADENAERALKKVKDGLDILVDYKPKRNVKFHRKFFAMINILFQNQEKYKNREDLLIEMKLKTGWYKEHVTLKGNIIYIPKSMSFDKMDDLKFGEFYQKCIDVALQSFNISEETAERLIRF